jgi:hypothetical protein
MKVEGTQYEMADSLIQVVGDSIAGGAVPTPSDTITLSGKTYRIMVVMRDPALALYGCICKAE